MSVTARVLSTYSADIFGVCSALYELGGLVVMHDASGCNSTYCTHDEPRWFDIDSMIYISALTEEDIIMGQDEKLIDDMVSAVEAAREEGHPPRFVALAGSPMPFMIGCDLPGVARAIGERTGLPALGLECGGIKDYTSGAGTALACLVDAFCIPAVLPAKRESIRRTLPYKCTINILGVTPLDFSINGNAARLTSFFEGNGFHVISSWAMDTTLDAISQAGLADVNVVVSATGLPAAQRLQAVYGTPYVAGIPIGGYAAELLDEVQKAAIAASILAGGISGGLGDMMGTGGDHAPMSPSHFTPRPDALRYVLECIVGSTTLDNVLIIGEAVFAHSLRRCLETDWGAHDVRVLCPLIETCGLLRPGDKHTDSEDEIIEAIRSSQAVIADPIYRRALTSNASTRFIDFPHEAYSGRMYRGKIPLFVASQGKQ